MPRPYRITAVAILAVAACLAIAVAATRLLGQGTQPGLYRQDELSHVLGYNPWLPTYVPADLHQAQGYEVIPSRHFFTNDYEATRVNGSLWRALGIAIAPSGQLIQASSGIGENRHSVRVRGVDATSDSWEATDASGHRDPKLRNRMLLWSESGLDFFMYAWGLSDAELQQIANSMAST